MLEHNGIFNKKDFYKPDKLMQHESVKSAYKQFLLVCELTKKEKA